jgi:hypothetical protein
LQYLRRCYLVSSFAVDLDFLDLLHWRRAPTKLG